MDNRWNNLSMSEKNQLLGIYVSKGYTDLASIISHYNSFATGGQMNTDGSKEEDNNNVTPNFVGGATALKKNYDYALEHMADKYSITAEGPWHDYGIHNPSINQKIHWNELARMYNRVAQRPDYEYLNPSNITEYTPVVGDAMDAANSINELYNGNTGLGLAGLGLLALPNIIEKPLKAVGKQTIKVLDDLRYHKYKKNARQIANNAYTNHLKRIGLDRNDIGQIDYPHEEDITRNLIQQRGYDVTTVEGRKKFLIDVSKIDKNATNEQVDNEFLKILQQDTDNGNTRPGLYFFDNSGQVIAVSNDAGMYRSQKKAKKGKSSDVSLRNGKILETFDWLNGNNEGIKSHELTHYLQHKNNLIDGSRVNNIFNEDKLKKLSEKTRNYFTLNNGTEADARLSQILDFYNISNNKKIKPSQIRYIKNNYSGLDNNIIPFLQSLSEDRVVADYINNNRNSKFLKNGGFINISKNRK